jgi:hypothetical protein
VFYIRGLSASPGARRPGILDGILSGGWSMKQQLKPLFWVETVLALVNVVLLVMTLVWNDWIEIVFKVDPDAGSGALEWGIVAVTLLLTLVFLVLARNEWRRSQAQTI